MLYSDWMQEMAEITHLARGSWAVGSAADDGAIALKLKLKAELWPLPEVRGDRGESMLPKEDRPSLFKAGIGAAKVEKEGSRVLLAEREGRDVPAG